MSQLVKVFRIFFTVTFMFSLICIIVIRLLGIYDYYLFINGSVYSDNLIVLICILYGSIIIGIWFFKVKVIAKLPIAFLCSLILFFIYGLSWEADKRYFFINTPNENNNLIIEERTFLVGKSSKCYVQINPHLLKRIYSVASTDDTFRPFSTNDYKINLDDD